MAKITLTVNGEKRSAEVEDRTLLANFLRDELKLTGTHVGCDTSQCGACTVHVEGRSVKACTMLAMQAEGKAVTTIEGIGAPEALHPMQAAFRECHALQCGFCTPGMIMSAIDLVNRGEAQDEHAVREGLEGNICSLHRVPQHRARRAPRCEVYAGGRMSETGIGRSVRRREDVRFITGRGRYTDDIQLPNQSYAVFLRSPYPRARIAAVDAGDSMRVRPQK